MAELGVTGLRSFGGVVSEEFLPNLRGNKGVQVYREMSSNSAIIGGILHAIIQSMRKVPWMVETPDPSQNAQKARAFVASCFNDMSSTWTTTNNEILSFLIYGWAMFEKVYKIRGGKNNNPRLNSKYNDHLLGWRKFAPRGQDTLWNWVFDDSGGTQGMWQTTVNTEQRMDLSQIFLPIQKCLLYRTFSYKNNPEGKSILRTAYRSWYFQKHFEEIMAIGVERDLTGLPTYTPPEQYNLEDPKNAGLVANVEKILRNVRRDQQEGILNPPGWKFDLVASPGQRQFNIVDIITYYDKRIALTVLGQFILLGLERVGSFALGKQSDDLFTLSLMGWVNEIIETTNRFGVDELLYLNGWGELPYPPQLSAGQIKDPDLNILSMFLLRMQQGGYIIPDGDLEKLIRKIGGLTGVPERPSIVREAKENDISFLPVPLRDYQIYKDDKFETFENLSDVPLLGKKRKSRPSFFVGIREEGNEYIYASEKSEEEARRKADKLTKVGERRKVFIAREVGTTDGGELVIQRIEERIPLGQVDRDDSVYLDFCKAQTRAVFDGVL